MVTCVDTVIPDVSVSSGFISTDLGCKIRHFVTFANPNGGHSKEFADTGEFQTFIRGMALGYKMAGLPLPKDFGEKALAEARRFESDVN